MAGKCIDCSNQATHSIDAARIYPGKEYPLYGSYIFCTECGNKELAKQKRELIK